MKLFDRIIFLYYIFRKFYTKEGKPLKCIHCKSNKIESEGIDTCFGIVTEERYICSDCKRVVAHWILGEYKPLIVKNNIPINNAEQVKTNLKVINYSNTYTAINVDYFTLSFNKEYKWLLLSKDNTSNYCNCMTPVGIFSIENDTKIENTIVESIEDWERQIKEFDKDKALASIQYMKNNVKEIAAIIKKEMENK